MNAAEFNNPLNLQQYHHFVYVTRCFYSVFRGQPDCFILHHCNDYSQNCTISDITVKHLLMSLP